MLAPLEKPIAVTLDGTFCRPYLVLKDGRTVKVASQRLPKSEGSDQPTGPLLEAATQLANFLGVPLQLDPQRWRAAE